MPSPNVSVSRDYVNETIYQILSLIDIFQPDPEELKQARKILLELSQYIIQAPIKDAMQKTRPSISTRH